MWLYRKFKEKLPYMMARAYLTYQSRKNRLKSARVADKVQFTAPYNGEKILLMALYQKGELRPDVQMVLQEAKRQGLYVIGVNTLKVKEPERYRELLDCYIEKYNFGRDFGSYKSGFKYVYDNGFHVDCPRLVMLNDSVFYSEKHAGSFLSDLCSTDCDALGATENYEIEHHLGSFCISLSNYVINSPLFKSYWQNYVSSDVRTLVIKNGEMELSKTLRAVARTPENFRALYDATRIATELAEDPKLLENILVMTRSSELVHWDRFAFNEITQNIQGKYLHSHAVLVGGEVETKESALHYADGVAAYTDFMQRVVGGLSSTDHKLNDLIRDEVIASFVDKFIQGSQIHQNNILLHHMGLAIIKLDGLYRGTFVSRDVEKLAADLVPVQKEDFRRLMYARPYGCNVLAGWKKVAFMYGLI
jgi:hypothetical protein